MHFTLFQNRRSQPRRHVDTLATKTADEPGLTCLERLVLYPFVTAVLGFLLVSGWSAILLATGNIESGGPLGTIVNFLISHIAW